MSKNATHEFPAPVGGIPDAFDFAPSIVFIILYAIVVPIAIWRLVHPRSRSAVLVGTTLFSIERVVSFALRAKAARDAAFRANTGLETYLQTSYTSGFIAIGQDLVNLLRTLLVASTLGGDMLARHKLTPPHVRKAHKRRRTDSEVELVPRGPAGDEGQGTSELEEVYVAEVEADMETGTAEGDGASARTDVSEPEFADQTKLRKRIRRWLGAAGLLFLIAVILSAVAGINYKIAVRGSHARLVRSLWYVSMVLSVALLAAAAVTALVALKKWPRVPRTSALYVVLVSCLLSIVGIYCLAVISQSTTSVFATGPGTQNSLENKAAFYMLHAVPEFASVAILLSLNARRVFGTGPWGDVRTRDPKPKVNSTTSSATEPAAGTRRWLRALQARADYVRRWR